MLAQSHLKSQQKVFLENYLLCWNATQAARIAGYKRNPDVAGSQMLGKLAIQTAVKARLSEMTMAADESLYRLSTIARGPMIYFLTPRGEIDLTTPQAQANKHLLKKVRVKSRTYADEGGREITETETDIETYDALAALTLIAKHYGLLNENNPPPSLTINQTVNVNGDLLAQLQQDGINPADVLAELDMLRQQFTALLPPPVDDIPPPTIIDMSPADDAPGA